MSKITNDSLNRSSTGWFIAVPMATVVVKGLISPLLVIRVIRLDYTIFLQSNLFRPHSCRAVARDMADSLRMSRMTSLQVFFHIIHLNSQVNCGRIRSSLKSDAALLYEKWTLVTCICFSFFFLLFVFFLVTCVLLQGY